MLDRAPRGLIANTTSGDVACHEAGGAVRVETVSGEVRVGLTQPLRRAELSSTSGDITAALLGQLGCTLAMRTASGTIDVDLPLQMKTVSRREVTGVVRDGTAPVTLRTTSGNISISTGAP